MDFQTLIKFTKTEISIIISSLIKILYIFRSGSEVSDSRLLLDEGIVALRSFVHPSRCKTMADEIQNAVDTRIVGEEFYVEERGWIDVEGLRFDYGYKHAHNINEILSVDLAELFHPVVEIVAQVYPAVQVVSYDAFITSDVVNPRRFHIDSFNGFHFKIFCLLDDVDLKHGPFVYIKRSHRSFYRLWSVFLNLVNRRHLLELRTYGGRSALDEFVAEGRRGDVFISDQHGWHKAARQANGAKRRVIVLYLAAR